MMHAFVFREGSGRLIEFMDQFLILLRKNQWEFGNLRGWFKENILKYAAYAGKQALNIRFPVDSGIKREPD